MRICFVNITFYPHIGGIENYILEIGKRLTKSGHDVMVVTSSFNYMKKAVPDYEMIEGIRIFRVPKDRFFLLRIMIKLIEIKLKYGIDIIHTNCGITTLCSVPLKILFGTSLVNTCHNAWMVCLNGGTLYFNGKICSGFDPNLCPLCMHKSAFKLRIERWVLMEAAKQVNAYIAVSEKIKQYIKHILPSKKICVIHNGVDIHKFNMDIHKKKQLRSKFKLTENDKVILFNGRHTSEKGVEFLIHAIPNTRNNIPNIKVIIVGDGTRRNELEKLVRRLNLEQIVSFPGFLLETDLIEAYSAADVVVLPSVVESFSLVLLEAMAMGKPVVATNVGGIPEAVRNGITGILVEPKNSSKIAEALIQILSDKSVMLKMGVAGRQRVEENFTWTITVARILSLYGEVERRLKHSFGL